MSRLIHKNDKLVLAAFAKFIGVCTLSVLLYFIINLPLASDNNPIAHTAPQEGHQPTQSVVSPVTGPLDQETTRALKGWTHNFADMPNGLLSRTDWNFETGTTLSDYNDEAQAYTPRLENVHIQDGVLVIEARRENMYDRNYTSARINTLGKFSFTYGTLEVDAMLPSGNGTWPAVWLMPRDNIYNPDDYEIDISDKYRWALNGEIDFVESVGRLPGQNIPAAHSFNQLHTSVIYTPAYIDDPYTSYHRYGVIKTPDSITYTLDGVPYASHLKESSSPLDWPFNQPYYLIMNLAIGGNWAGADGIDDSSAPWQMKIKSLTYTPM